MRRWLLVPAAFTVLGLGCDKGAGASAEGTGATTGTPAPTAAGAGTSATAAGAGTKPAALPAGRSAVPSLAEYAAASEVTVKGSSALKCETKMIREWLRISCRGKNDTGGTPTTVKVVQGGGEAMTFASGGVTSLVAPVVQGTHLVATFSWSDKSHKLVVDWPRGAPKPPVTGVFEGAASPLDGTAPSALMCECHKKVRGATDCSESPMAEPDCERTYAGDCQKIIACAFGEPGIWPKCTGGKRNAGVMQRCFSPCGANGACPAGTECSKDWGEPAVCM